MKKLLFWLLYFLPKNYLSQAFGKFVNLKIPGLAGAVKIFFVNYFGINMDEAEYPITHYKTFGELFARRLKKGVRSIQGLIIHPADSDLTQIQQINQDQLLQAKGKAYSLEKLLKDSKWVDIFKNGYAMTYYLCPRDYHRVHMPVDGSIIETDYVPGELWPVNRLSAELVENLFAINERTVSYVQTHRGFAAVIMVGATNVGKITLAFDKDIVTNQSTPSKKYIYSTPHHLQCGDEFGTFNMGSTVIVLYESSVFTGVEFNRISGGLVKMGERLF